MYSFWGALLLGHRGTDLHPRRSTPMFLPKPDTMFSSPDWTYEPKWEGFRVLASGRQND